MKKLIILLPVQVAEMIAQRAMQTEAVLDYKTISEFMSPSDQAALLAFQEIPALKGALLSAKAELYAEWIRTSDGQPNTLAVLRSVLMMSENAAAQQYAGSMIAGTDEKDCVLVKSLGGNATGIVLKPGAIEHLRNFNNHLPILKKIMTNKLIGKKLADIFKHDGLFAKNFISHSARFGDYLPPSPIY